MVTTTYSRYAELKINLPTADAAKAPEHVEKIEVTVDANGAYLINNNRVANKGRDALAEELRRAAGTMKDPVIVITADAQATHQSVIRVMEAAQADGYGKITFTTQTEKK
jgi:biopolymer transport protein ExbD